jgi:hypothetical protein
MYYIYCLKENQEIKYIGQTINPQKRKRSHKNTRPLHEFEILFQTEDKEVAKNKEIELIFLYKTFYEGWNKSPGGEGFEDYSRKGIGGVKIGYVPWNKNKKNCFSEETINHFKNLRKGKIWKPTKITKEQVKEIRDLYEKKFPIDGVGEIQKNGKIMSYEQAFSIKYSIEYGVTKQNIRNIIQRKSWKHV